jgi:hypothetical protein
MKRFIEGEERNQVTLFPVCIEDYVGEDNPVRVVDVFVEGLDLRAMGFAGIGPAKTGRPAYHPAVLLKIYIYGYLNRIQSSRRLERETQRNGEQMQELNGLEEKMLARADQQLSLTDPDARSMKNREGGIVGYNVQTAVDAKHHLIVAHEVVTEGVDRDQLTPMAEKAREATRSKELTVVADRGYFKGEQILQCEQAGITPIVPKTLTSNSLAEGRFDKQDFIYIPAEDQYRCPAGERAIYRLAQERGGGYVFTSERAGPMTADNVRKVIRRAGEAAKLPFPVHPHMLRHACGYKLANDGHDTRAIQHYLGHRNIQHTVKYTELAPGRFKDFWRD